MWHRLAFVSIFDFCLTLARVCDSVFGRRVTDEISVAHQTHVSRTIYGTALRDKAKSETHTNERHKKKLKNKIEKHFSVVSSTLSTAQQLNSTLPVCSHILLLFLHIFFLFFVFYGSNKAPSGFFPRRLFHFLFCGCFFTYNERLGHQNTCDTFPSRCGCFQFSVFSGQRKRERDWICDNWWEATNTSGDHNWQCGDERQRERDERAKTKKKMNRIQVITLTSSARWWVRR